MTDPSGATGTVLPQFGADFCDQFDNLLAWRRDIRHFRTAPLPDGMLETLLQRARWAPSVGNSQPWRFVRLRSARLRAQLADHVDEQVALAGRIYDSSSRGKLYGSLKLHGLREAPEVLAIFCDEEPVAGHRLGAMTMPETRAYSVVLAIQYLWLAARARGIGLGWVSILDPAYVHDAVSVPQNWRFIALLCLGYPEQESATPELQRRGWQDRLEDTLPIEER